MEILDALERKVTELLKEIADLREHNARLEAMPSNATAGQSDGDKIARLEEALSQERALREAVLKRVITLAQHLEEQNSAG